VEQADDEEEEDRIVPRSCRAFPPTALLILGDVTYSDGVPERQDSFVKAMQPLLRRFPVSTLVGNHEVERGADERTAYTARFGDLAAMVDEEGAFDVPAEVDLEANPAAAFALPHPTDEECTSLLQRSRPGFFYSYDVGLVHVLSLCSYCDLKAGDWQWQFALDDLRCAAKNRAAVPFVMVATHIPPLHSNWNHLQEGNSFLALFEDVLVAARVDFVAAGHVHTFETTTNAYNNTPDARGPVYAVMGAGGNREGLYHGFVNPKPAWSVYRGAPGYGYGAFEVFNHTHAKLRLMMSAEEKTMARKPEPIKFHEQWITTAAYREKLAPSPAATAAPTGSPAARVSPSPSATAVATSPAARSRSPHPASAASASPSATSNNGADDDDMLVPRPSLSRSPIAAPSKKHSPTRSQSPAVAPVAGSDDDGADEDEEEPAASTSPHPLSAAGDGPTGLSGLTDNLGINGRQGLVAALAAGVGCVGLIILAIRVRRALINRKERKLHAQQQRITMEGVFGSAGAVPNTKKSMFGMFSKRQAYGHVEEERPSFGSLTAAKDTARKGKGGVASSVSQKSKLAAMESKGIFDDLEMDEDIEIDFGDEDTASDKATLVPGTSASAAPGNQHKKAATSTSSSDGFGDAAIHSKSQAAKQKKLTEKAGLLVNDDSDDLYGLQKKPKHLFGGLGANKVSKRLEQHRQNQAQHQQQTLPAGVDPSDVEISLRDVQLSPMTVPPSRPRKADAASAAADAATTVPTASAGAGAAPTISDSVADWDAQFTSSTDAWDVDFDI
jgi:hypothetical protein